MSVLTNAPASGATWDACSAPAERGGMGHARHPRRGRRFALVFAGAGERVDRGALAFKQLSAKPMAGGLGVWRSFAPLLAVALG
ncbi:hypothetical protein A7X76_07760 [Stenotrophomonas maltophilia]|nr:hypothetical protein A7X76_07760 [Stenotrophomonas maltophilia]